MSATVSNGPERVLYFGINSCAQDEAKALDKATKSVGGIIPAYPVRTATGCKISGIDVDLRDDKVFEKFLEQLVADTSRRDRLRDALSARTDAQRRAGKQNLRGVLSRLAQIYSQVEAGELRVRRMVLSGHASRTSFFDDFFGGFTTDDLQELSSVFPLATGGISHLMVSGCYTGFTDVMEIFRRVFPNLKTIWAYWAKSPTGEPKTGSHSCTHILEWERQTRSRAVQRLDRRRVPEPKAKNVAVWSEKFGAEPKVRPLDVVEADVANHLQAYTDAFEGNDVRPEQLLNYYTLLNELCGHPDLPESRRPDIKKKVTQTLLLRFYPAARRHFARYYRDVLEKGYAEIQRPVPPFGTLSRKAALAAIENLENAVLDDSLQPVPAADLALATLKQHLLNLDMPPSWAEDGHQ